MYKNFQTLRGHIFHVLQHFGTKLGNSTNFRMLFLTIVKDIAYSFSYFCSTFSYAFQNRRQTRSSVVNSQPLSPSCSENIIPEPTKPAQTSVQPLKIPASTASLGKHG